MKKLSDQQLVYDLEILRHGGPEAVTLFFEMAAKCYDCRGYHGEVLIEGMWHTVWQFGSMVEAERFARGWGGVLFDEATQAKVTERRAL